MKLRIAYLAVIPATLILTQCAEVSQELDAEIARENRDARNGQHYAKKYNRSGNGNRYNNSNEVNQSTFNKAYLKGQSDARSGKSKKPDRYSYIYSEADRQDFFNGYASGYNSGR